MSQTLPTVLKIHEVIPETKGIKTFVFESDLEFQPGQFVMVWLPRINEKPFGMWRMKNGELRITVSAVGKFSKKIHEMRVGGKVGIRGPFGHGFTIPKKKNIALVGGGFGVAPLLGILEKAENCKADFIIGARSENLIFGKIWAEKLGAKVSISTDDGSCGEKCFNTQLLEKLLGEKPIDAVFSCGPELMMKRVAEICAEKKIDCELNLERFMKCGIGVCGSCTMDDSGFCVCKEGPVISGEKALEFVEFGKYRRDNVGMRKEL